MSTKNQGQQKNKYQQDIQEDDYGYEDEEEMAMMQQMGIGSNSQLLKQVPKTQKYQKQGYLEQLENEQDDEDMIDDEQQNNKENLQQQNMEDYSSSDLDDDQDEDLIDPEQQKLMLIQAINQNPDEFQYYQKFIEVCRQNGQLDDLRQARQSAQSIFCLPVYMWQEWIQDEIQYLEADNKEQKILDLCNIALKDYRYYKVCKILCRLLIQFYENQQGDITPQQVRDGFEKALLIYGLDVNRSVKFWEPYLTFEKQELELLLQKQQFLQSQNNEKELRVLEEEISKQNSRIRSIYRRRVIFPTQDMFIAWADYEQWENDQEELQKNRERYEQANLRINEVVNFEEKFQNAYQELENNMDIESMIKLLKKDLDQLAQDNFNYIMLYFERILSEYTQNLDLWQIYIDYTDEKCKKKELKQEIYEKAVKNCPQNYEFWLGYLRELEKNEAQFDNIVEAANKALSREVSIQFHYEILKYLCEYQVRQLVVTPGIKPNLENDIVKQQIDLIRGMYQDQIANLKEQYQGDQLLQYYTEKLQLSWAEVEAYKIQDKKQVQELMEDYVKKNGHQLMSWTNYIKLMREFPDHEKTLRGLFKRGLQVVKDNKILLGELWLEWEKKFSTIQSVDQCIKHLKKLHIYSEIGKPQKPQQVQQQITQQNGDKNQEDDKKQNQTRQDKKRKQPENDKKYLQDKISNKRPKLDTSKSIPKEDQQNLEEIKEQNKQVKLHKKTLYLSQLNEQTEEEDIQQLFNRIVPDVTLLDIRLIRDEQGKKRGFAFVDVENQEMAEKSLKLNNYNLKGSMLQIHIYKPPNESEKEDFTVYVHNLPQTCNEEKLRAHFKQVGEVDQVRLIRHQNGMLKGYAYIQFIKKASVNQAIETLNKNKIDNRTIVVERTKSKKEAREEIGHTVFIKNLDYKVTEEDLKNYLEEHFGEVKRLNLTKDEKGHSKGLAFAEFVEEACMNKAIEQKEIQGLGKRLGIIQKSLRQITQPKQQGYHKDQHDSQKKRDAKQNRRTLLSSMINDIKSEQQQQQQQDQSLDSTSMIIDQSNKDDQLQSQQQQNTPLQQEQKKEVNQINTTEQESNSSSTSNAQMSNADFKKMLLSKKR